MRRRFRLFDLCCLAVVAAVIAVSLLLFRTPNDASAGAPAKDAAPTDSTAPSENPSPPRTALETISQLVFNLPAPATTPEVAEQAMQMEPWRRKYFCCADFNKDNRIDSNDLLLYLNTFQTRSGPAAEWLDVNGDGTLDDRDTIDFLNAFFGTECDPAERALLRGIIC